MLLTVYCFQLFWITSWKQRIPYWSYYISHRWQPEESTQRIGTVVSSEKSRPISLWQHLPHPIYGTCAGENQGPGESRGWSSNPSPTSCVTSGLNQLIRIPPTSSWKLGTFQTLSVYTLHALSSKQSWGKAKLKCHVKNHKTCSDKLGQVTCLLSSGTKIHI